MGYSPEGPAWLMGVWGLWQVWPKGLLFLSLFGAGLALPAPSDAFLLPWLQVSVPCQPQQLPLSGWLGGGPRWGRVGGGSVQSMKWFRYF